MIDVSFRHRFAAVQLDIAFRASSPGITVLFGPSGAGKSSVVSALAGLLRPDEGRLVVDGMVLSDTDAHVWVPPERRRMGMVFQDARLFPHFNVGANLQYGRRRAPPGPMQTEAIVALLGIGGLLGRRPHTLSGGERQRVAIGRALLSQPRLLLMDEPLAGLDAARRADILPFLAALRGLPAIPLVYVTHAIEELTALADTVVLLESGRVVAHGRLDDISARADLPLARRADAGTVLAAEVTGHDPSRRLSRLALAGGVSLLVPLCVSPPGTMVRVRVLARELLLATHDPGETSAHNVLHARTRTLYEDSARHAVTVELDLGEAALLARITPDAVSRLRLEPGGAVIALLKSTSIEVQEPVSKMAQALERE